ncbi:MAG TPA: hypothetical protein ENJ84_14075 [Gammaproteobacteria bacterium]|nr:hypothetical protein [Gammaproteobacteria bacterium]
MRQVSSHLPRMKKVEIMRWTPLIPVFLFFCFGPLMGCGGAGPDSTVAVNGDSGVGGTGNSDEGIGGTGIGTVTGFSSVIINQTRIFKVDDKTVLRIDGERVSEADLRLAGLGLVVSYQVGTDVNADFTRGTLISLDARHYIRGPVTSLKPLTVLDQVTSLSATTVLVDQQGGSQPQLKVGDIVEISGFADGDNRVRATRLQVEISGQEWKLTGIATKVNPGVSFSIGSQTVLLNGVLPQKCGSGLREGDLVEVEAQSTVGFKAGDVIDTVTKVKCEESGLNVPENQSKAISAEIEGVLSKRISETTFIIAGQQIQLTAQTRIKGGRQVDLTVGVLLEVEGSLLPSGILEAEKIEFKGSGDGESGDGESGDEGSGDEGSGDEGSGDEGSGDGESGDGESGDGESGDGESGDGESGDGESGDGESGDGESGDGESGDGESGDGESGDGESGDGESGDGESGDEEPGDEESGDEESGDEESGDEESGDEESGDG